MKEIKLDEQNAQKEINTAIRDGINQWADVMLESEVKQWAYRLDYFPRDLMNAIYIFQHVASNIGIKAGRISEQNTEEFGHRLRQLVIDMTVRAYKWKEEYYIDWTRRCPELHIAKVENMTNYAKE